MSKLYEQCEEIYIHGGASAVYDFINQHYPNIPWEYCDACDAVVPAEEHSCLVCSNYPTKPDEDEWDDFGN